MNSSSIIKLVHRKTSGRFLFHNTQKENLVLKRFLRTLVIGNTNEPLLYNYSLTKKNISSLQYRKYGTLEDSEIRLEYKNGLPVISVPLPSKQENCRFTLRPVASTVGDFINNLKVEDKGIDNVVVYYEDGTRVASSTQIDHLLRDKFNLSINNKSYHVEPPSQETMPDKESNDLDQTKVLISQLYAHLHLDQHQQKKEQQLKRRLEDLKVEMGPLEQNKIDLANKATKRTRYLLWGGLAGMSVQFGLLARLTWWEYSWDIMEPVTYFITYGTAIGMYGYFLLTQQEYVYPDARDRQFLRFFHKYANKSNFDVSKYNQLCDKIAEAEQDLKRLRDPLQLNLPSEPIRTEKMKDLNMP